mgnify:CR=1 FL=1
MLQFKVPQNIKMPDQIIGPLTLEQFLYLLFASGIIYVVYIYVGYNNYFYALSIPVALMALAFAFVPVNEQPFSKFVANFVLFLFKPKTLLWLQLPPPVFETAPQAKKEDKKSEIEAIKHPEEVKSQLQQLSLILDTQMTPQDIRAKAEELNVEQHSTPTKKPIPSTSEATKSIAHNIQSGFKQLSSTITGLFTRKPKAQPSVNEEAVKQKEDKKQKMLEIARSK